MIIFLIKLENTSLVKVVSPFIVWSKPSNLSFKIHVNTCMTKNPVLKISTLKIWSLLNDDVIITMDMTINGNLSNTCSCSMILNSPNKRLVAPCHINKKLTNKNPQIIMKLKPWFNLIDHCRNECDCLNVFQSVYIVNA